MVRYTLPNMLRDNPPRALLIPFCFKFIIRVWGVLDYESPWTCTEIL
jgi:hypothetical protein